MSAWTTVGLIADGTFEDPANARIIYLAVGGLLLLAVLLGVGTWLWWRSSKVEHPVLAPLEVMGTRRWWKSDFNERQRRIEEVRPAHDDADLEAAAVVEAVDLEHVMTRDDPHTFDDLMDPDAPVVAADEVAEPVAADAVADDVVAADDAVTDDEVADDAEEPVVDDTAAAPEPAVEPEPVAAVADVAVAAEAQPEPESEAAPAVVRSIVIDTAPKPRDTPADLGPEPGDDPTPVPIDPLLRLQSE